MPRELNAFFTSMLSAKRAGRPSFAYRGSTYRRGTTKSGLVVYKKGPVVYRAETPTTETYGVGVDERDPFREDYTPMHVPSMAQAMKLLESMEEPQQVFLYKALNGNAEYITYMNDDTKKIYRTIQRLDASNKEIIKGKLEEITRGHPSYVRPNEYDEYGADITYAQRRRPIVEDLKEHFQRNPMQNVASGYDPRPGDFRLSLVAVETDGIRISNSRKEYEIQEYTIKSDNKNYYITGKDVHNKNVDTKMTIRR